MNDPNLDQRPTPRLFGSKAADIAAGIVAGFLWCGLTVGATALDSRFSGLVILGLATAFMAQLVVLAVRSRKAGAFLLSQILTIVLLPLLALGLLFGACLIGGKGFSMH